MLDFFEDLVWVVSSLARRAWGAIKGFWWRRSLAFRQRSVLVALILVVYCVIRFLPVPGLSCELSPAKHCPPGDDAIALVPADAYAYAHLNLERDSTQVERASELAGRFPHFEVIERNIFAMLAPAFAIDPARDILPWIGGEAAVASLATAGGDPEPLALLEVGDEVGAEAFLDRLSEGAAQPERHRGVGFDVYGGELATVRLGDFLALGSEAAVRAAIDVDVAKTRGLPDSEAADAARSSLPEDRLADAYLSEDGIAVLLGGGGAFAAQLDVLVDFDASRGVAVAVVAEEEGLEITLDSELDAAKLRANPGFFAAFPSFRPSLGEELADDSLAYLGIADPDETIRLLLDQAAAAAPGIPEAFDDFNRDLEEEGGVSLDEDVLPLLRGEAAIAIAPADPLPYVTAVFDDVDEDRARTAIAQLQGPIIGTIEPEETGQAPSFEELRIGDITAQRVRLGPALDLTYAIFDGRLVASTDPAGVRDAIEGAESLADDPSFEAAASGSSEGVATLLFLNLDGLVRLAEPRGLAEIEPYVFFRDDISKLKALGLAVVSEEDRLRSRLFLGIAE